MSSRVEGALDDLAGHAISYRIAVGPNRGQKAFALRTLPAVESEPSRPPLVANAGGFSLHAGVSADKDPVALVGPLLGLASRVVVSRARHRGMAPEDVAAALGTPSMVVADLDEALDVARRAAREEGRCVLVAGGLFLAAEARSSVTSALYAPGSWKT